MLVSKHRHYSNKKNPPIMGCEMCLLRNWTREGKKSVNFIIFQGSILPFFHSHHRIHWSIDDRTWMISPDICKQKRKVDFCHGKWWKIVYTGDPSNLSTPCRLELVAIDQHRRGRSLLSSLAGLREAMNRHPSWENEQMFLYIRLYP